MGATKGRRAPGQQGRSVSLARLRPPAGLAHPQTPVAWLQERPGQTQLHHCFFSFNRKERKAKKVNTQIFTEITQIFNNSHPRTVRQTGLYIHVNLQNAPPHTETVMYLFTRVTVSLKTKTSHGHGTSGGRENILGLFPRSTLLSRTSWYWMHILCLSKNTYHFISQLFGLLG